MVIWGNKMDELIIRKAVETDIDKVEKIYNIYLHYLSIFQLNKKRRFINKNLLTLKLKKEKKLIFLSL